MADLTRKTANLWGYTIEQGGWDAARGTIPEKVPSYRDVYALRCRVGSNVDIPSSTLSLSCSDNVKINYVWIDENGYSLGGSGYQTNGDTATAPNDAVYMTFILAKLDESECTPSDFTNIMLVAGSTPLPYEPYGWVHSLRKMSSATETIQSGDTIYANGQPISTYTIKGNTVQDGTPTPSNPVDVNGVGERTENLYNYQTVAIGKYIDANGVEQTSGSTGHQILNHTAAIPVIAGTTYTFKIQKIIGYSALSNAYCWFDSSNQLLYRDVRGEIGSGEEYIEMSYTAPSNAAYLIINFRDTYYDTGMLNTGSTALPYEPYGFKIPISTLQGSAVNYLGNVQSKRQIGNHVFTGTEDITKLNSSADNYAYYYTTNGVAVGGLECTHLPYLTSGISTTVGISQNQTYPNTWYMNLGADIMNAQPSGNTVEGFKEWLSAQYAAGTPVTVWYIKQTATTGIVNEPLMKIGDYSDSISNATAIPTTDGANSITVDTTVQPSEFTATWTGWHDSSVQEYQGGVGNQKFDKSTAALGYRVLYTTGEIGELSSTFCSDFIPVVPNTTYTLNVVGNLAAKTGHLYALYDSDKEFVDTGTHASVSGKYVYTFTIPSGIAYIRFNGLITNIDETMLNEGETALPYEPYENGWV